MTAGSLGSFGRHHPPASPAWWLAAAWALAISVGLAIPPAARANLFWQGAPARQVVVFGVEATPGSTQMDAKIAPVVQAQLRRLLPNHGFRLIKIKSSRVAVGGAIKCELDDGFTAAARLMQPLDSNGKIQMHFELMNQETSQFQTIVTTPPDQFNFFDKAMPTGNRLLVGVGAR